MVFCLDVRLDTRVVGVDTTGVHVQIGDESAVIAADTVVLALGRVPADGGLESELRAAGLDVRVVGSAVAPGRVFDAIHSAFFAARLV